MLKIAQLLYYILKKRAKKQAQKSRQKGGKKGSEKVSKKAAKKVAKRPQERQQKSWQKTRQKSTFLNLSCCCLETGLKPDLFILVLKIAKRYCPKNNARCGPIAVINTWIHKPVDLTSTLAHST